MSSLLRRRDTLRGHSKKIKGLNWNKKLARKDDFKLFCFINCYCLKWYFKHWFVILDKGCHGKLQPLPLYFLDEYPFTISSLSPARITNFFYFWQFLANFRTNWLLNFLTRLEWKCSPLSCALTAWSPAGGHVLEVTELFRRCYWPKGSRSPGLKLSRWIWLLS